MGLGSGGQMHCATNNAAPPRTNPNKCRTGKRERRLARTAAGASTYPAREAEGARKEGAAFACGISAAESSRRWDATPALPEPKPGLSGSRPSVEVNQRVNNLT